MAARRAEKKAETVRSGLRASTPATGASLPQASHPAITHPDRLVFPDLGLTKLDLAEYYAAIAKWGLPHIKDRPLSLLRCPEGIGKECFFQKHFATGLKSLDRVAIAEKHGIGQYVVLRDADDLVALVQEGVIEIHPWGALAEDPDRPDQMIFDLDPAPEVEFAKVSAAALALRARLATLGLVSFVKTTGGKGLHVVVKLRRGPGWQAVKEFARAVAVSLAKAAPADFTVSPLKRARTARIFIDYLRNDRGATAVAPYAVRARRGAPVALPLAWEEVTPGLEPRLFTLASVPRLLAARRADPWRDMIKFRHSLSAASRRALGLDA